MNYCIKYTNKFRYFNNSNVEIEIMYSSNNKLLDFCKDVLKESQKLVVNILDEEISENEISVFEAAAAIHPNILFKTTDIDFIYKNNNKLNFLYAEPISCWRDVRELSEIGISEILIRDYLCFDLEKLKTYCDKRNIKIRCVANYIEEDRFNTIPPYEEFFIRPEDVSFYEDYIDTIEFYKDDYYELLEKQNILYKIYNSGKWEGKLSDIIDGYTEDVLNTTVLPSFAKFRVDCQRRCDLGLCDSCKHHTVWAKTLEKSGIKVTTKEVPPDDR